MGSLFRGDESVERFEAFSVLASGCRQLAQTCLTDGAREILRKLADQLDQQASQPEGPSLFNFVEAQATPEQPAPLHCA